jgi:hypothetical protein
MDRQEKDMDNKDTLLVLQLQIKSGRSTHRRRTEQVAVQVSLWSSCCRLGIHLEIYHLWISWLKQSKIRSIVVNGKTLPLQSTAVPRSN